MKKLLSMLLSAAMVIALVGPVVAVEETNTAEPLTAVATEEETQAAEISTEEGAAATEKEQEKETDSSEPVLSTHANKMTYYEGGYGAMPGRYRCSVDIGDSGYGEWFDIAYGDPIVSEWPTTVGNHTVSFDTTQTVNGVEYAFTVSMEIDVLALPELSGQCGESMEWKFDTASDTLYLSGKGDMYTVVESRDDFYESNFLYEPGWYYLPVRHVVVEEGVENLSDFAFANVWNSYYEIHETIQLPTTLQAIPEFGFMCSMAMESLTIPEGITSITGWPFGAPGNSFMALKELHLPASLTEMDITTIMLSGLDTDTNQPTLQTIYFAGTQDQWDAIARVESESIKAMYGDDYEAFYENWCKPFQEIFEKVNVVCTGTEDSGTVEIPTLNITLLSTQINVSSMSAETTQDRFINEETGEEGYGPEWTYYDWAEHCRVSAVIDGETYENVRLSTLAEISGYNAGVMLSGGIIDDQSYENQWEVGGSYPVTYYIFAMQDDWRTLWSADLTVTICEPSPKIQVSDIVVDELAGMRDGDITYYRWEETGKMTVTIDDQEYAGISMLDLNALMVKEYGGMSYLLSAAPGHEEDIEKIWNAYENPWTVGDELYALLTIYCGEDNALLYNDVICIRLCETQVEWVSIAPITYYAYQGSKRPVITAHYKDGTSEVTDEYTYTYQGTWPKTAGTYTMSFTVADTFAVDVPVTVLPTPTSGNLGSTVTWSFDETTKTLTLSGTGAATLDDFDDWTKLYIAFLPEHVVVKEGIESLPFGIFHYSPCVVDLSLPTTLKGVPCAMVGFNGPTVGTHLEEDSGDLPGMTSITLPEGITSLTNHSFYLCWGITDFYLPASLEELDIDVLCSVAKLRTEMGLAAAEMTIHFAGTQSQWDAVQYVVGDTRNDYGSGLSDAELETMFATFTVICANEDETEDSAVMDLSGDGVVTVFDAQILAEAKAGLRTLTEEQWAAIGDMKPEDILNYVLGK